MTLSSDDFMIIISELLLESMMRRAQLLQFAAYGGEKQRFNQMICCHKIICVARICYRAIWRSHKIKLKCVSVRFSLYFLFISVLVKDVLNHPLDWNSLSLCFSKSLMGFWSILIFFLFTKALPLMHLYCLIIQASSRHSFSWRKCTIQQHCMWVGLL